MRKIDSIIIHCSATRAGLDFTAADIDRWHRERGFNGIGYHYVIRLDGRLEKGRDISLPGAHCRGWNERSIGICYIGGLDGNGQPADTRTNAQKRVLYQVIMDLQREYEVLRVLGHRDTSPDLNGDGVIGPDEYVKACPCFDVRKFLRSGRLLLFVWLLAWVVPVFLSGCGSKREVVGRSYGLTADSSSRTGLKKKAVGRVCMSEGDSELVEEHIEQVVFVFAADTLGERRRAVVKTVTDRKRGRENLRLSEELLEEESISYADSEAGTRIRETERTVEAARGKGRWKAVLFLSALAAVYLFYRRKRG